MGVKLRRTFLLFLLALFGLLSGLGLVTQLSHTNVNSKDSPPEARTGTLSSSALEGRMEDNMVFTSASSHCPYYPPDVRDIPFIFSRSTVRQFTETVKRYPKERPILLLVVHGGGLPLLANWLCVSAQHIDTESVLVVVPPEENGMHFEATLNRKGITAVQTSFR